MRTRAKSIGKLRKKIPRIHVYNNPMCKQLLLDIFQVYMSKLNKEMKTLETQKPEDTFKFYANLLGCNVEDIDENKKTQIINICVNHIGILIEHSIK